MDPLVTDLIRTIRKATGFEKAFVAGGAVRDTMFKSQFADIDILVPSKSTKDFQNMIYRSLCENPAIPLYHASFPESSHYDRATKSWSVSVAEFKLLGLEIDVIGVKANPAMSQEDLICDVVGKFNFNINKIGYDGHNIVATDEFQRDFNNKTVTVSRLDSLNDLPKAMVKINGLTIKHGLTPVFDEVLSLRNTAPENDLVSQEKFNKSEPRHSGRLYSDITATPVMPATGVSGRL